MAADQAPLFGVMLLPVGVPFSRVEETARTADELGYDSAWLFDHLDTPHAESGGPTLDLYEGWTTATMVLARTERLRVGHNVLCASFRHPALLAKMAATLDIASGGRLELGLGWGSMPEELRRYGYGSEPGAVRAARLRETLEVLDLMFSGEPFAYAGEHFSLPDAIGRPTPVRGRIPIQIGGAGRRLTMPLVARFADWWNCPSNALDRFDDLRPLAGQARVALQCVVGVAPSSRERDAVAQQVERRFAASFGGIVTGTPDEVAKPLRSYVEMGVEQIIVQFHDYGRRDTLALFAQEVMPQIRDGVSR